MKKIVLMVAVVACVTFASQNAQALTVKVLDENVTQDEFTKVELNDVNILYLLINTKHWISIMPSCWSGMPRIYEQSGLGKRMQKYRRHFIREKDVTIKRPPGYLSKCSRKV